MGRGGWWSDISRMYGCWGVEIEKVDGKCELCSR